MLLTEGGWDEKKNTWALTCLILLNRLQLKTGELHPMIEFSFSNFCVGRLQCRITNSFFHRETVEWLRPVKLDANEVIASI